MKWHSIFVHCAHINLSHILLLPRSLSGIVSFNSFSLYALATRPVCRRHIFAVFYLGSANLMIYFSFIGIVVCRRAKIALQNSKRARH